MANTVSLDVAKRLKEIGLEWKPKEGDWFIYEGKRYQDQERLGLLTNNETDSGCYGWSLKDSNPFQDLNHFHDEYDAKARDEIKQDFIWLPTLSDILSRLREKGIMHHLRWDGGRHKLKVSDGVFFVADYDADTPEDSAALALIWALGQEGGQP